MLRIGKYYVITVTIKLYLYYGVDIVIVDKKNFKY